MSIVIIAISSILIIDIATVVTGQPEREVTTHSQRVYVTAISHCMSLVSGQSQQPRMRSLELLGGLCGRGISIVSEQPNVC